MPRARAVEMRARTLWSCVIVASLGAIGCGESRDGATPDAANLDAGNLDASVDTASQAATCAPPQVLDPAALVELTIAGDAPAAGIFDPSIVYPGDAIGGAMAYSAVPDQLTIRTHVAVSSDHGATWAFAAELNTPEPSTQPSPACGGTTCTGNLISEVPSLVFDADEPDANRRWKLFAHRYLVGAGVALHYDIGTITLQTAAQPQGPWTAPQKLIGWTSSSPYSSTGVVANVSTLPGTARDCIVLTEPAAIWLPGRIDLAVGCVYDPAAPKIRIELLRSTTHAANWASVSTLLTAGDAACSGLPPGLNGASLFATGGTEYVVASPADATGYRGCLVFAIADIAAGTVERDARGHAIARRALTAPTFDGACTFADGAGGYAIDIGAFGTARPFRIFRAGVRTP
jgi:hypothetical protein